MSKSMAIAMSLLALCLGLMTGMIAMSSQVEEYKKEKHEVENALIEAKKQAKLDLASVKRQIEAEKRLRLNRELSLKTELNKAKYANNELKGEINMLRGKLVTSDDKEPGTQPAVDDISVQSVSFFDIRNMMTHMTEAQWKAYGRSLKGKVVEWQGWVDNVNEKFFGGYELWIDMDSPEEVMSVQDVTFDIPNHLALRLMKDQRISFRGTIDSVLNILGSCQINLKNASVLQY